MSEFEWICNVRVLDRGNTWQTITPDFVRVRTSVTEEVPFAEIRWIDNGKLGNTISPDEEWCGCTVEIYAGTIPIGETTPYLHKVFRGRVSKIGQEYTGLYKEKPEKYIEAFGMGKPLQDNEMRVSVPAGSDVEQFNYVVDKAIEEGLISGKTIYPNQIKSNLRKRRGRKSYWDILKDIAQDADWDFYVDNDGTLHAFPRGIYESSYTIVPDFRAKVEWDDTKIINTIEVRGRAIKQIGDDETYSDDNLLYYWTGTNVEKDSDAKVGNYCVKAYQENNSPILVFHPGETLDLSAGGKIHLYLKYYSIGTTEATNEATLEVKAYTDDTNYFVTQYLISGGRKHYEEFEYYALHWKLFYIPFNFYDPEGWTEVGDPKWEEISSISFKMLYPIGLTNSMYIDDFYISDIDIVAYAGSIDSINKYGIRRGPSLKDGNIKRDEEAQALANVIIATYAKPTLIVSDVEVDNVFDLQLGYQHTVSLFGKEYLVTVRNIEYTFQGKTFKGKVTLGERYLPSVEKFFKDAVAVLRMLNWNIEMFYKIYAGMGQIDVPGELIDYDRVAELFQYEAWTHVRQIPILAESKEGYDGYWGTEDLDKLDCGLGQFKFQSKQQGNGLNQIIRTKHALNWTQGNLFWKAQVKIHAESIDNREWWTTVVTQGDLANSEWYGLGFRGVSPNIGEPHTLHFWRYGYFTIPLQTIEADRWYLLEFRYFNDRKQIEYYVNEVCKGTVDCTLVTGTIYPFVLGMVDSRDGPDTFYVYVQSPVIAYPWYHD